MKLKFFLLFFAFSLLQLTAQEKSDYNTQYRAEREKINNLKHTKLKVSFDYAKRHVLGEAWLTLSPHFYNTSTLTLDAKAC